MWVWDEARWVFGRVFCGSRGWVRRAGGVYSGKVPSSGGTPASGGTAMPCCLRNEVCSSDLLCVCVRVCACVCVCVCACTLLLSFFFSFLLLHLIPRFMTSIDRRNDPAVVKENYSGGNMPPDPPSFAGSQEK